MILQQKKKKKKKKKKNSNLNPRKLLPTVCRLYYHSLLKIWDVIALGIQIIL